MYAAGFCSVLASREGEDFMRRVNTIYATSTAAVVATYTASSQPKEMQRYFFDLLYSRGIVWSNKLWKRTDVRKLKTVFEDDILINAKKLPLNPNVIVPLLNIKAKSVEYIDTTSVAPSELPSLLMAAQAFPIIDGSKIPFNNAPYIDGGVVDTLPVLHAADGDHDTLLVFTSRPLTHRRTQSSLGLRLLKKLLAARTSLHVASLIGEEDELYNQTMKSLQNGETINDKAIIVIEGTNSKHGVQWNDGTQNNVQQLWNDGAKEAKKFLTSLKTK